MSVRFEIDEKRNLIIAVCEGVFDAEDARAEVNTLWKLPGRENRPVIWDFRAAELDIEASEPREIAKYVLENQPSPPPRVAFVTPTDLAYGLARMFEAYREDPATEFGVFRDFDEAVEWAERP